tara:strand:+ start:25859 stop:26329 length:471 start_codon:yes stop_codon:yes gene_type:complete
MLLKGVRHNEHVFISARIQRLDINGEIISKTSHIKKFNKKSLLFKMSLPHQGLLTHKSYFQKYGLFDPNLKFCMDYDHLLRSYKEFPNVYTKDIVLANWRADGIGNGKYLEIFKEYNRIKEKNKVANKVILILLNFWILFKHFLNIIFGRDYNVMQ